MWRWVLLGCLLYVLLVPSKVFAGTSVDVVITVTGFVVGAPGAFTVTYVDDETIRLSWIPGSGAVNTMVRSKKGGYPSNRDDGSLVYYGNSTSTTDKVFIITSEPIYYKAWSRNISGQWEEVGASGVGNFMSQTGLWLGFLILAGFLTVISWRRPSMLLSLAAGLTWLGMGFWLLLGSVANLNLADVWTQLIAYVFIIMTFVPFLFQMDTEIKREHSGRSWTELGPKPKTQSTNYERYREELRRRLRKGGR